MKREKFTATTERVKSTRPLSPTLSVDQLRTETQFERVDSPGRARCAVETKYNLPGRPNPIGDQKGLHTQSCDVAEPGRARSSVEPNLEVSGRDESNGDQTSLEPQRSSVTVPEPSSEALKPSRSVEARAEFSGDLRLFEHHQEGVTTSERPTSSLKPVPRMDALTELRDDQSLIGIQRAVVVAPDRASAALNSRSTLPDPETISAIRIACADYWTWLRAEVRLANQAGAILRGLLDVDEARRERPAYVESLKAQARAMFDTMVSGKTDPPLMLAKLLDPFIISVRRFREMHKDAEKEMEALALQLPVSAWTNSVPGIGAKSLAMIIGETGDLNNYATVSRVWKRMCVAVLDGIAQGKLPKGASSEEWIEHGANKHRRAVLFNSTNGALMYKHKNRYGGIYDKRRARTSITHPDWTKKHSDEDARRIVAKEVLKDLWVAWTRAQRSS